ncbi:MAG: lysostaphin resistance A-like protein [Oscillospiraceae bacterium]
MTGTDILNDAEIAPDRAERKKLRKLYNKVGGAMVIQYVLMYVIYAVLLIVLSPFILEETDPETGFEVVGWADAAAMYFAPALASTMMFVIFNAVNNVKMSSMFRTRNVSPQLIGCCILGAFAFHAVGIGLEYVVDIVLYNSGLEVVSFDYEMKNDVATAVVDVISSVIIAPIAEELFFRGVVLKQTARVSTRFGIIFSGVMFGLMHGNPYQFVMAATIGIYFAYITVKTDSLIPAIICHAAVNGMMCLSDIAGFIRDELAEPSFYVVLAVEIILGLWGIRIYIRNENKPKLPPYTAYHKKRTLPILITSVWVIIITLIYIYDIYNSVAPISSDIAEELITQAV